MVALSEQLIRDGESFVQSLDAKNAGVTVAFWSYFSDIDDWKLIVCFPGKDQKEAYTLVQSALHSEQYPVSLKIDQIGVIPANAPIVKLLSMAIQTGPGISNIRFTNNVINGTLIEDAHIYRLSQTTA